MRIPFSLLLALNSITGAFSQEILQIPYAQQEKTIDGKDEDWSDGIKWQFQVKNPQQTDSNFDDSVQVRLEWDELYLYGLVQVYDHQFIKLRYGNDNPTLYLGDAVELYLDPLNDSRTKMDVNDYQFIMDIGGDRTTLKGDKHLADSMWLAPKENGAATIAFRFRTLLTGTLNMMGDRDSVWQLEFALPWAALGKTAAKDSLFRLDVCLDDMDSLIDLQPIPEGATIPCYAYGSLSGAKDFSFPDRWLECRLTGEAGFWLKLEKKYLRWWPMMLGLVLLLFLPTIFWQQRKIRQLRQVPIRADMRDDALTSLVQHIDNKTVSASGANAEVFDKLRTFILQNLHQDISPAELAQEAHMSLRQLQRLFREELQTTPNTFILLIKMEQAAGMLRAGKANISEIAYDLGFSDPAYFSRVFRKYHGVAPTAFR